MEDNRDTAGAPAAAVVAEAAPSLKTVSDEEESEPSPAALALAGTAIMRRVAAGGGSGSIAAVAHGVVAPDVGASSDVSYGAGPLYRYGGEEIDEEHRYTGPPIGSKAKTSWPELVGTGTRGGCARDMSRSS